jgi:hypothetical protein
MITIPIMARMEIPSAIFSRRCIRRGDRERNAAPVRQQAGNQKQQCISG